MSKNDERVLQLKQIIDKKKTEIKETANGQVEDFFDDTP